MRFSLTTLVAALPALGSAQDNPMDQYYNQVQGFIGKVASYVPNPGYHDPVAAMEAKVGALKLHTLTLDNWKDTLYEPVPVGAVEPVEWWVLLSGRNKTCHGRCGNIEKAFNETAGKFAVTPGSPYMGLINCDDQPILCNSWAVGPGNIFAFEMLPPPAQIEVYKKRLNLTTTDSDLLVGWQKAGWQTVFPQFESYFHPFQGKATELGLSVPYGYFTWVFNMIPSWAFMLIVSFASRTMMSNRMNNPRR